MKDFVLSLLSRGFGQIVPDESGHNGSLEVCYEPEVNYFYIPVYMANTTHLNTMKYSVIPIPLSSLGLFQLEIPASTASSYRQW